MLRDAMAAAITPLNRVEITHQPSYEERRLQGTCVAGDEKKQNRGRRGDQCERGGLRHPGDIGFLARPAQLQSVAALRGHRKLPRVLHHRHPRSRCSRSPPWPTRHRRRLAHSCADNRHVVVIHDAVEIRVSGACKRQQHRGAVHRLPAEARKRAQRQVGVLGIAHRAGFSLGRRSVRRDTLAVPRFAKTGTTAPGEDLLTDRRDWACASVIDDCRVVR